MNRVSGERLLIIMMYVLLIDILGFAFVFKNHTYSLFVIGILTLIIVIEMLYVFVVYPKHSLCDICKDMWCDEEERRRKAV